MRGNAPPALGTPGSSGRWTGREAIGEQRGDGALSQPGFVGSAGHPGSHVLRQVEMPDRLGEQPG